MPPHTAKIRVAPKTTMKMIRFTTVALACCACILPTGTAMASNLETNAASAQNAAPDEVKAAIDASGTEDPGSLSGVSNQMGTDLDSVFSNMQQTMQAGGTVNFSEAMNLFSQNQIPSESYLDLSDVELSEGTDIGSMNMAYSQLSSAMKEGFTNTDLSGDSQNCVSLLKSTYGNLAKKVKVKNATLPKGFTVKKIMSSSTKAVNSTYKKALSNAGVKKVKKSINTGSIFATAKKGMSAKAPKLTSADSLMASLTKISATNKSSISSEFSSASSGVNSTIASAKNDAFTKGANAKSDIATKVQEHANAMTDNTEQLKDENKEKVKEYKKKKRAERRAKVKKALTNFGKKVQNIIKKGTELGKKTTDYMKKNNINVAN